jgi:hypothetical protein
LHSPSAHVWRSCPRASSSSQCHPPLQEHCRSSSKAQCRGRSRQKLQDQQHAQEVSSTRMHARPFQHMLASATRTCSSILIQTCSPPGCVARHPGTYTLLQPTQWCLPTVSHTTHRPVK